VDTRTVLDLADDGDTLPGALPWTLVTQHENAFTNPREVPNGVHSAPATYQRARRPTVNVGVWLVPVVLVALLAFLWAATWLESRIAPRGHDPGLPTVESVDTAFDDVVANPPEPAING
jgi:hypothetical protein